jgi:hypothetical protein
MVCRSPQKSDGAAAPQLLLSEATRLSYEHKITVLRVALVAGMAAATSGCKP